MPPKSKESLERIANHALTIFLARAMAVIGPVVAGGMFYWMVAKFDKVESGVQLLVTSSAVQQEQIRSLANRVTRVENRLWP